MAVLNRGDKFSSYAAFCSKLNEYEEKNYVNYYIIESRTIEAAKKTCPRKTALADSSLKYYFVKLQCVHGGEFKKSKRSKGVRKTSTRKHGCEAFLHLTLDGDGKNLTLSKMSDCHNHEVSRALYKKKKRERALTPEVKQETLEHVDLKANKKLIQDKFCKANGGVITSEDISNIGVVGGRLSVQEKYKSALSVTNRLAEVIFETADIHFNRRLAVLEQLYAKWCAQEEVALVEVNADEVMGSDIVASGDMTKDALAVASSADFRAQDLSSEDMPNDALAVASSDGFRKHDLSSGDMPNDALAVASSVDFRALDLSRRVKPHACDICRRRFKSAVAARLHKLVHKGEKHVCDICKKKFGSALLLRRHRIVHTDVKLHACDICGKRFKRGASLKLHKIVHVDEKPHACNICWKRFKHASQLRRHKITHTDEKPYEYDACGKRFKTDQQVNQHMPIHTGKKPNVCDISEKSFSLVGSLTILKQIHTIETPYECDICGKIFKIARLANKHKLIHTGEKPHL